MRWVGDISYEMYLWHWPLYLVLTPDRLGLGGGALLAVRLSAVVAFSAVTHFYVGEPIRRGVRLRSPRLARVATVGVVVRGRGRRVRGDPHLTSGAERRGRRGGQAGGPPVVPSAAPVPRPVEPEPAAPAPVALPSPVKVLVVGDSQAATLAQGLDADPGVHGLSAQPGLDGVEPRHPRAVRSSPSRRSSSTATTPRTGAAPSARVAAAMGE